MSVVSNWRGRIENIDFVAVFIVIITISVSGQTAKHKHAIEQEIRKLELAHPDAVLRGDLAALDKLWTKISK